MTAKEFLQDKYVFMRRRLGRRNFGELRLRKRRGRSLLPGLLQSRRK